MPNYEWRFSRKNDPSSGKLQLTDNSLKLAFENRKLGIYETPLQSPPSEYDQNVLGSTKQNRVVFDPSKGGSRDRVGGHSEDVFVHYIGPMEEDVDSKADPISAFIDEPQIGGNVGTDAGSGNIAEIMNEKQRNYEEENRKRNSTLYYCSVMQDDSESDGEEEFDFEKIGTEIFNASGRKLFG